MNVNFATSEKTTAKKYFESSKYNWLSKEKKQVILDNLSKDCRVQDPTMYDKPRITVFNQSGRHYK